MTNYEKIMKTVLSFKSKNYKIAFSFMNCSCQYLQTIIPLCFYNKSLFFCSSFHSTILLSQSHLSRSQTSHLLKSWHLAHNFSIHNNFCPHPWRLARTHGPLIPNPGRSFLQVRTAGDLLFARPVY